MLPTDPGLYSLCFWSTFKCFEEVGNTQGTDAQTDILQRRIYSSQKSHSRVEVKRNYYLWNLLPIVSHGGSYHPGVPVHPDVIGAHQALLHSPFPILWLHHKFARAGSISWSLFKADNELFVLLLEFHHIKVLLIKMNKIIHVAQMSQCCLITNFPIKIKLGHLQWNIKTGME